MVELFFSVKTKDEKSVKAVLAKQKSVEFGGLNVLADLLEIGQLFFIVFGGDKPAWETGLVGLGELSKLPYDYKGRNFKIQIDIKILFSKPVKRDDLVLYPDTYNILGIGPITKWEPNQALTQIPAEKAYALLNAIFNIDKNKNEEFKTFSAKSNFQRLGNSIVDIQKYMQTIFYHHLHLCILFPRLFTMAYLAAERAIRLTMIWPTFRKNRNFVLFFILNIQMRTSWDRFSL